MPKGCLSTGALNRRQGSADCEACLLPATHSRCRRARRRREVTSKIVSRASAVFGGVAALCVLAGYTNAPLPDQHLSSPAVSVKDDMREAVALGDTALVISEATYRQL